MSHPSIYHLTYLDEQALYRNVSHALQRGENRITETNVVDITSATLATVLGCAYPDTHDDHYWDYEPEDLHEDVLTVLNLTIDKPDTLDRSMLQWPHARLWWPRVNFTYHRDNSVITGTNTTLRTIIAMRLWHMGMLTIPAEYFEDHFYDDEFTSLILSEARARSGSNEATVHRDHIADACERWSDVESIAITLDKLTEVSNTVTLAVTAEINQLPISS